MIFSIHIPKTAGTSFRNALKELYGERLALFYGENDPATHPLLRVPRAELASRLPALADEGVEVLHGHYHLSLVESAIVDPRRQLWTWLRDPVERVISHYSFIKERPTKWAFDKEIKAGQLSLTRFARKRRIRNIHSTFLAGVELKDFAFVGVTERFELGLALLFGADAPQLSRRYNAINERVDVTPREIAKLHALNRADVNLYAEGLRLMIDRVADAQAVETPERPKTAGTGIVRRLIRKAS